jgi:hypothetical protein
VPRSTRKRSTKRTVRKHEVKADLTNFELTIAGSALRLRIYADREKLGEMEVGRGSLYWHGRHKRTRKRINWSRFATMMDELAFGATR